VRPYTSLTTGNGAGFTLKLYAFHLNHLSSRSSLDYGSSSQLSGTCKASPFEEGCVAADRAAGCVDIGCLSVVGRLARFIVGVLVLLGRATTEVQLPIELEPGVGAGEREGSGRVARGARISANLPKLVEGEDTVAESDGFGMRVSMRRMSWTLR